MSLTAAGTLLPQEEVQAVFSTRSKMLVAADFVAAYLGRGRAAYDEAQAMVWLAENVIGATNKRHAARWLDGVVGALRFETELRAAEDSAAVRLGKLAALQRQVGRCGLAPEDAERIQVRLGDLGGTVEADARLTAQVARAPAPPLQKLTILLRLATGDAAPLGPAADRARQEALRLVRDPQTRACLAAAPEQMDAVRGLIQQAGLAA
jgi:hypothetical protein